MAQNAGDSRSGITDSPPAWARARRAGETARGASRVYELFVLGHLMDRPLHGYAFHHIANTCFGPFPQLSWGTLYPLIRRLQDDGLIEELAPDGADRGRPRRVYQLAERGRQRFLALMLEPGAPTEYPELFAIKLVHFGHLTPSQRLTVLRHYRGHLQYVYDYNQANVDFVRDNPSMAEAERPHVLRLIAYRSTTLEAELRWVDGEIAALTSGMASTPA